MSDDIGISYHDNDAESINYNEHYHDFVKFVYILKGKCIHTVDGVEHPIGTEICL